MNKVHAAVGAALAAFGAALMAWDVSWLLATTETYAYGIVLFFFVVWMVMTGLIAGVGTVVVISALRDRG